MNKNGKNIVRGNLQVNQLATKLSLHNKTKEELQAIVQQYPYFAFAQFLLNRKMKDEQDADLERQTQKTTLYFSNPFWFRYLTEDELYIVDSSNEILNTFEQPIEVSEETNGIVKNNSIEESEQFIDEYNDEASSDHETNNGHSESEEHEKLSKLIEQHLSEFKKPVEDEGEIPVETRVYHTIDYFASQGIKLEQSQFNQDMLGSKVKKFTDWLKQMKHVNQNPTDLGTDTETEHLIEKIAQTSNETKEVITETMAEVLLKQGKTEKAIQLYKKLSFLDPSKSAYFAAKINELKDSQ